MQGDQASKTMLNSFPNAPTRLHFPERPRTIPLLGAAAASRSAERGELRAMPLTAEIRPACAQNLLAERLMLGPQYVPATPAVVGEGAPRSSEGHGAVSLTERIGTESDSDQVAPAAAPAALVAARRAPRPLPQRPETLERYIKMVAQVAALADGGMYGMWCCAVEEPSCYGARAVFRKALDLLELGVAPENLAPLLRRHTEKLTF